MTDLERTLAAIAARPWWIVLDRPASKKPAAGPHEPWPVTRDPERVRGHLHARGNAGLVAGEESGVAILDPDEPAAWAEFVERLGEPGPAWVETGSGRQHYYVRWEPELPAKLVSIDGEIIGEIMRGPGQQQCVCPPSIHPDTRRPYRWLVDPVTEPLRPLPEAWRVWFRRPRRPARPPASAPSLPADVSTLVAAALAQPGARRRASGIVKFACPACRDEGFDVPGDNAALFPTGRWGCAWAAGTALGRSHWEAIGIQLGALHPAVWRPW